MNEDELKDAMINDFANLIEKYSGKVDPLFIIGLLHYTAGVLQMRVYDEVLACRSTHH